MSADDSHGSSRVPYWRLIAVLTSSCPLSSPLAMRLYRAALELHRDEEEVQVIRGDLGEGEVRRLGKEMVIGAIGGPGFEAEIDTGTGSGRVRFIVTREGLDEGEKSDAARRALMN